MECTFTHTYKMKHSIQISLDNQTLEALNSQGFTLCVFMACQSDNHASGMPLCWSVLKRFFNQVQISWTDSYFAYISSSEIKDKQIIFIPQPSKSEIVTGSSKAIQISQSMIIQENFITSIEDNTDNHIQIYNKTNDAVSSGVGVSENGNMSSGTCVFPLHGNNSLSILPQNKIFLSMIPSSNIEVNMAISSLRQNGLLVDMDHAGNDQTIRYDINKGWQDYDSSWAKLIEANSNLSDLLITPLQ
jgi:hypothetical protein